MTVPRGEMHPRHPKLDVSGFSVVSDVLPPWPADATLAEIARRWEVVGRRGVMIADAELVKPGLPPIKRLQFSMMKSQFQLYDGDAEGSYETISRLRASVETDPTDGADIRSRHSSSFRASRR